MGIKAVSVSQLNNYIKRILQTDPILGNVTVIGEISNLKFHGSGHVYFSLKDEKSRLSCFLSSGDLAHIQCELKEGANVVASGYIYLYERGGSYSLNVKDMEEEGQGDLAKAFQRLKEMLEREGIFDKSHKKALPQFPNKIAAVTSETGAAVRDILKIITKKNDVVDVMIYPVLVQGPDAPEQIASAIDDINKNYRDVDIIIAGRGGGSMEDLWAFNEECVARSIYSSVIPVISAVGHETDFTIADFAADVRAETPTAAAEMAVPDTGLLRNDLVFYKEELKRLLLNIIQSKQRDMETRSPESFGRDIQSRITIEQMRIDNIMEQAGDNIIKKTLEARNRMELYRETVEGANPGLIISRGYSVVRDEQGNIIKDMTGMTIGQMIKIEAAKGYGEAQITSVGKE